MPKAVSAKKVKAARASPMEATVTPPAPVVAKAKKPRQSSFITSKNHALPTVTVSQQELNNLALLSQSNRNRHEASFNCLFTRQNKFGGWEFQLTDGIYESLMEIVTSDMEFNVDEEGASCCLSKDDYTGHWRLRAKLSKKYLAEHPRDSVPIPADGSIVNVTGAFETSKVKGKDCCYFQIDGILQVVASGSTSEVSEEDEE